MSDQETIQTREELEAFIKRISFMPSCVDMHWEFEIQNAVIDGEPVWTINTSFERPDTDTGAIDRGKGRKLIVYPGTTHSGVFFTCFLLAKLILEHELMEAMLLDGRRPLDPHNNVLLLAEVSHNRRAAEGLTG